MSWPTAGPRAAASCRLKAAVSAETVETLKKREDFVRLRRGRRSNAPAFLLQSLPNETGSIRVGYTVTKKIGNAVCRNRIKRRFRAAARELMPRLGVTGYDYVLIARPSAIDRPWSALLDDLSGALKHAAEHVPERPKVRRSAEPG